MGVICIKRSFFPNFGVGTPIDVGMLPDVSVSKLRRLGTLWRASGRVAATYRLRRLARSFGRHIGACIFERGNLRDIIIHPDVPAPGAMGALPSCLRGSWRCGASLGSITIMFLMSCSRIPHPQVVVEALAAFRRQDSRRISRCRLGGAARGCGRRFGLQNYFFTTIQVRLSKLKLC